MAEVACLGAANVDMIAKVDEFPSPDEEITSRQVQILGGGGGANVAVGLSRLRHSATFIGIMGKDNYGKFLEEEFKKEGVDFSGAQVLEGGTGVVFALVDRKGQRMLITSPGGTQLSKEHITIGAIRSSKVLFLTNMQGPKVAEAFEFAAEVAKKLGVKVVFDPGNLMARQGLERLRGIMKNCYAFLPSSVEAEMLTGEEDPEEAAKIFLEAGPKVVVVKTGKEGCVLATSEGIKSIPNPIETPVVDTTGAGDSFAAGFISGILEALPPEKAAKQGCLVARISCSKIGARATPTKEELAKFLVRI